jgi:hypothetical protein
VGEVPPRRYGRARSRTSAGTTRRIRSTPSAAPPTDLALHPNSPGYRLILNNVLFPAAKKKPLKT